MDCILQGSDGPLPCKRDEELSAELRAKRPCYNALRVRLRICLVAVLLVATLTFALSGQRLVSGQEPDPEDDQPPTTYSLEDDVVHTDLGPCEIFAILGIAFGRCPDPSAPGGQGLGVQRLRGANVSRTLGVPLGDNDALSGIWSNSVTLWIAKNGEAANDAIYAYDLKSGERVEEREFDLDKRNLAPRGIWSDGQTIWVSDSGRDHIFAHDLESGERRPDRDLKLHETNVAARGIWSDGPTMYVLDGRWKSIFSYDLMSGDFVAEYGLASTNRAPHDLWSDGTTVWVSDEGRVRLFAYRLPREEAQKDVAQELVRVPGGEFGGLARFGSSRPGGIWSDDDVMYVMDATQGRMSLFEIPEAIDTRLALLALSEVDIGGFVARRTDYDGSVAGEVTETTVEAVAMRRGARVAIEPPDADADDRNGHQVALEDITGITVTVTSPDGSRTRTYRVRLPGPAPLQLILSRTWTSFEWPDKVLAVYQWDEPSQTWRGFFPGLGDVPDANTLMAFRQEATYWIAVTEPVTWLIPLGRALTPWRWPRERNLAEFLHGSHGRQGRATPGGFPARRRLFNSPPSGVLAEQSGELALLRKP